MTHMPFHADHVGSLLRPSTLLEARKDFAAGALSADRFKKIEDDAVRSVVKLQEDAGLQSITDGEFRRGAWHTDFLTGFEGIDMVDTNYAISFRDDEGNEEQIRTMMAVTGKISRAKPFMIEHFEALNSYTSRTAKFSIPSPTYIHMRGGRKTVPAEIYPDIEEFWADVIAAYRAQIQDLANAGCKYLQLDDVSIAFLCDENIRNQVRADGMDPDELAGKYADVLTAIAADRPDGMTITMHTCRGNHHSKFMAAGGYDAVAENFFSRANLDGFFLEFDDDRSGGFAPLKYIPQDRRVVLGLVSSKQPALENADDLKRRIDDAAQYFPIENLCISPQCGFASTSVGNQITEDTERRKLALLVEVAESVWGSL
jgi:5-methyltetrahydropteroyltriglutamate--homocysteine methyltransferase